MPHVVLVGVFLGVAGFAAGIIGTAGGITTLVTYPALLAVGIAPSLRTSRTLWRCSAAG